MQDNNKSTSTKTVNGIKLKEGQVWTTTSFGKVTLSKKGVSSEYPWYCSSDECNFSITEDGKYWEDDNKPILLELIKEETTVNKFNPQPGDKIICNNGEEFICCTLEFLHKTISKMIKSDKPILGYQKSKYDEAWQDWDEEALACPEEYGIREIIPQSLEAPADKKEELKEEPRYTVDEVFDAIFEVTKHFEIEIPWDYIDDVKEYLSRINDPQYQEYLRLKAIYE